MPLCRPRVFFDTCVYLDAVKQSGGIPPQDWRFVDHYIQRHYRVVVSWTTIKELLCKLENCSDEYFVRNQAALQQASRHGRRNGRFLENPQIFAIRNALGIDVYPQLDREGRQNVPYQQWAQDVVDSVFNATSKRELLDGVRSAANTNARDFFDLSDFAAHEEQPRSEYVRRSEGWRTGQIDRPHPITVAANLLRDSGVDPYTELCQRLSLSLDAVNSAIDWFWKMSKNPTYDFETRKNNWDDIQQLYYLCNSSMVFVTLNTRDFMQWMKGSKQISQVLSWQQFFDNARHSVAADNTR